MQSFCCTREKLQTVMCLQQFGHDQVPAGIWETHTMIRQCAREST